MDYIVADVLDSKNLNMKLQTSTNFAAIFHCRHFQGSN